METTFHNTIALSGHELKEAVQAASKQDECILLVYKNTRKRFTPWDIHGLCTRAGKKWPITSCRRSITNLMNKGELIKTSEMKPGEYGKPETYYVINFKKYPSPPLKQTSLFE